MLSRVAESLYWMARYIERAEAVARLAAVDFQALLDGTRSGRLEDVIRITSDAALFKSVFPSGDERGVLDVDPHAGPHGARDRHVLHVDALGRGRLGADDLIHERDEVRRQRIGAERHRRLHGG